MKHNSFEKEFRRAHSSQSIWRMEPDRGKEDKGDNAFLILITFLLVMVFVWGLMAG